MSSNLKGSYISVNTASKRGGHPTKDGLAYLITCKTHLSIIVKVKDMVCVYVAQIGFKTILRVSYVYE